MEVAVACALALVACLGAAAEEARAGTYRVLACEAAERPVNNAWRERDHRGMLADATCSRPRKRSSGLLVQNRVGAGRVRRGKGAVLTFSAPRGTLLQGITVDWDGRRASAGWRLGLVRDDGRLVAGCRPAPPARAACRLGDPKGATLIHRSLTGARSVRVEASCAANRGCDTSPLRRSRDRTRVRLALHHAAVSVSDRSAPNLVATGDLLGGGWHRGDAAVAVQAGDNVGIRGTALRIDGTASDSSRERCDFTRPVPCPRTARATYAVDTRALDDGPHELALTATDAARNAATRGHAIRVDNNAPGQVAGVRVLGGQGVHASNSFDLRWNAPRGQAAPITGARYRLCRVGARQSCATGARAGAVSGIDDLEVPARGTWRFQVWLEDAAGNVDPGAASEPVMLRFDDRTATRVEAGITTGGGQVERRATVDFGTRPAVAGTVADARGDRLAGAALVLSARTRGAERFRRIGTTSTDGSGRFRHRLPTGPSRMVRVSFRGSREHRPAHGDAGLSVRAASTIAVSRRRVRNGGRVRFEGRLLGRPLPAKGKLLQLEAFYRERWRTFAVVRSAGDGRWRHAYRFETTTGRVRYPFRVRIPREPGYPYAVGRSRTVSVTVSGP